MTDPSSDDECWFVGFSEKEVDDDEEEEAMPDASEGEENNDTCDDWDEEFLDLTLTSPSSSSADESSDSDGWEKVPRPSKARPATVHDPRAARARLELVILERNRQMVAEMESTLPEIVRRHVLRYLPAKTLLRLKCVSPKWNSWISSPFFAHDHCRSPRPVSGVFYRPTALADGAATAAYASFGNDECSLDPALGFLPEPVDVRASSNGLLCCLGRLPGYDGGGEELCRYYVCNPATGKWAPLPSPPNHHGSQPAVVLTFEEPWVFNFFADYHVVCAFPVIDGVYGFDVFSSRTWEWKTSSVVCETDPEAAAAAAILPASGVGVSGKAYWQTSMLAVVEYDPMKEKSRTVLWPGGYEDAAWGVTEVGRRLCCVCLRPDKVAVYAMDEEGERWVVVRELFRWRDRGLLAMWSDGDNYAWPLPGQGVTEVLFRRGGMVMAVDMGTKGLRAVRTIGGEEKPLRGANFMPYNSSLIPVKRDPSNK